MNTTKLTPTEGIPINPGDLIKTRGTLYGITRRVDTRSPRRDEAIPDPLTERFKARIRCLEQQVSDLYHQIERLEKTNEESK